MKSVLFFISLAMLPCTFSSCKKAETAPGATITIYAPTAAQAFKTGDTVEIKAVIEGETTLHGYEVAVTTGSGDSLFHESGHTHAKEIHVNHSWIYSPGNSEDLVLHISSEINHEGLGVTKSISINTAH